MTNVKLKLMFFLLNALLSADIVHARPYSNNSTDIVIKFASNSTFNLQIDSNSDTLTAANDDETPEQINKSSNTQMEAIVNAEQDRDEALSEKTTKDERTKVLNLPPSDADAIEKQLNISRTLLEEIIDSETDREDTITDILFRPESEFVEDGPKFEFLIAARVNESEYGNKSLNVRGYGDNALERNTSNVSKKVDYVELVEVDKPLKENRSAYMTNITGHEVENDLAPDTSYTDVQTLFLACFGTLVPLLLILFATLFIRCLCRRYCPTFCKKPTGSSVSDSSEKQDTSHQQIKSPIKDRAAATEVGENGDAPPANGSVFTMTLKNNHLIVETEERNDITKNGRETKMKYSPDNDGIFVVEVQQSSAYRPNKNVQNSPPHDPQITTNQALIHRVPEELDKKIEDDSERSTEKFDKDKVLALSSTGLSISDLSMSSIGSHNVSYSYSSQMGYEQGPFGYPVYAGYDISKDDIPEGIVCDNSQEPLISKTPVDPDKPVITAAIFKQDSIIGSDALQGPGYCLEGSTDGPLLSDVQAREYSLQHLHDQKKIENGVTVDAAGDNDSKSLNRADSLPVRLEDDVEKSPAMETIKEDEGSAKEVLKGKRASLPIIRTDVYDSDKDVILASGSPKFEKLQDDTSPGESVYDSPPMITITEESESSKSEGTS